MSHPEFKELTRAEELFDNGKLNEALEMLKDWNLINDLNPQQRKHYQFVKGLILTYQNKSRELIKLGEDIIEEGQKFNDNLQSFDGFFFKLTGLGIAFKFSEAFELLEKVEAVLRLISNVPDNILIQREVRYSVLRGWINFNLGKIDIGEKYFNQTLGYQKELGYTFEFVWANLMMAYVMMVRSRYDLAIEYTKKALTMAYEIKFKHFWIAFCELGFGVIYSSIGELDIALKHNMNSLAMYKEIKNDWYISAVLNNTGLTLAEIGDYETALEYLEESLIFRERNPVNIENALSSIITTALNNDDIKLAQKYFHRFEMKFRDNKNKRIELLYKFNKALMLKGSSRIRDNAKAEELLTQVVETESFYFDLTIDAYIHLCDLLLSEYRINNNDETLNELNQYIAKLLNIAKKSNSYLVFCKTFILQSKLALINFNVKEARQFLTQAQNIAESYGMKRLAMKISYEHDEIIKQINIWEKLRESEITMSERWKLAGLSEQMKNMVRKQMVDFPEVSNEEPVLLLIVSEGGTPFFSQSFITEKSFESHLFGGFLSTIDYFIKEVFSEGLDRAVFGNYTLLMKSIPPFFVSYIFKGNSYYALQKMNNFINKLQNNDDIWKKLLKYFQANQSIQLNDIPKFDSLINEIFITK